ISVPLVGPVAPRQVEQTSTYYYHTIEDGKPQIPTIAITLYDYQHSHNFSAVAAQTWWRDVFVIRARKLELQGTISTPSGVATELILAPLRQDRKVNIFIIFSIPGFTVQSQK